MCSISGIKWDSHLTSDPTSLSAKIDVIHTKIIKTVKHIMVSFIQFRVETLLAKKAWTSLPAIAVYWSSAKAKESSTSWSKTVEITVVIGSSEEHFSTLATAPSPPKLKGICKTKKYPAYILHISSGSHGTTGERMEKSCLSIQNTKLEPKIW